MLKSRLQKNLAFYLRCKVISSQLGHLSSTQEPLRDTQHKVLIDQPDANAEIVKEMKQINHLDNLLVALREGKKHNKEFNAKEK